MTLENPRDILLATIRARQGEWLSRSDLALSRGTRRMLSHNDLCCLNILAHEGLIEVQQRPHNRHSPHVWFYRAMQGK
jgi:hypothetical protein